MLTQTLHQSYKPLWPICSALLVFTTLATAAPFTPLAPLPAPRITSSSPAYPGGKHDVGNLLDGNAKTEYSSDNKGTNTMVEFDFDAPVRVAAFRHVDRDDPGTIAESVLEFQDENGATVATVPVVHVNKRASETLCLMPSPILARRVSWHVTKLGGNFPTIGGAEVAFFTTGDADSTPSRDRIEAAAQSCVERESGKQPIQITLDHLYLEPCDAVLRIPGADPIPVHLTTGLTTVDAKLPAVSKETDVPLSLEVDGKSVIQSTFHQKPVRQLTVYVLPHSHNDIGYTEIQTEVEKKQVNNLLEGIAAARRTASYPEGSRFVWNVEVLWSADLYLHRLNDQQRADFFDAVKKGQVVLNGMYLNTLTGLCRPEELIHLFRFATEVSQKTGVPIDSAMISDVPGYTWGSVTAMNQAGIKYFSTAPNYFDRIGTIMREWENKPFYWVAPDGKSKVLVWIPYWGYAMSHLYQNMTPKLVNEFCAALDKRDYPFDIAYVRWSGHGDNAVPDPSICEFVRDWNAKYAWPHFVISGTSDAFRALEQRYGDKIPQVRGDWTPYWEDGAGSSALETAQNRQSSDRLAQAATVFAMLNPGAYPADGFDDAWKNVLLYSEHTWGAWCSIDEPQRKETLEQWEIKKSYANQANAMSCELMEKALASAAASEPSAGVDILNTLSWTRSELVTVPAALSAAGDRVTDDHGKTVPSQRLTSGELVFLAKNVPALSTRRYHISAGTPASEAQAAAEGSTLDSGVVRVCIDSKTGGIVELSAKGIDGNLVDTSNGEAVNDYLYLKGDDLKDLSHNGPVTVSVGEKGPLVASLIVESQAPGCKNLRREVRVVAGQDYVKLINLVDKAKLENASYRANEGKESVNFAFPFNIPQGDVVLDLPLGVMRPEADQMPSACKNWVTVGRWADVSNADRGVTWVTLDAPLVEVGELSARLLNSQTNPDVWRKTIGRTQRLYSWAMNNHWGTNYRAYQDGPTVFRFILRPHRKSSPADASHFATGFSQPLLARPALAQPIKKPMLQVSRDVSVLSLKPSDDGKAWIVRLFGASGRDASTTLKWGNAKPSAIYLSGTSEAPGKKIEGSISVPGYSLVTLRAEF